MFLLTISDQWLIPRKDITLAAGLKDANGEVNSIVDDSNMWKGKKRAPTSFDSDIDNAKKACLVAEDGDIEMTVDRFRLNISRSFIFCNI